MDSTRKKTSRHGRRWFLRTLGLTILALAAPKAAWAFFVRGFPVRTVEDERFDFDPASGLLTWPDGRRETYRLRIDGLVQQPLNLTHAQLTAMEQTSQISDFHCVEGWSVADLRWGGLSGPQVLALAQPLPQARYVVLHAMGRTDRQPDGLDHYVECLPLADLADPQRQIILALTLDGKPLPADHGAPLRLIAPLDMAYKSIKFVDRLEFSATDRPGWWTAANPIYPSDAPVPAQRLRRKAR
ncbi:oxidoreductase molybdopterin binding protein [Desulfarculus baarsii DSM 2075]|uniref:Oxidoreductase molybdopterin binding protein n=1 Tax=Desulfarculus baarsii (strain ATCC 33931 / DSM 2075 / LMG 7858 / VKM B-1802 / 2st14) TaxID=644282 RepID=E1QKW6_DESB2|nr:molybdopterin-dependent oxidoreductase [Desulfarculus baarsii]ADK86325.1 oxidoreductase molybdopterin binding protein [Desulfarculus baarsii DSM 2075]